MSKNMMNTAHKTSNEKSRKGYDAILWDHKRKDRESEGKKDERDTKDAK